MHIQTLEPPVPAAFTPKLGRHVLLALHDHGARYAVADMLLDADFRLTLAASCNVASMLLDSSAGFDLLVADQTLPGFSGAALARLAQEACPGLPVLLLEEGAAAGAGVLEAAVRMMERWPVTPS